jgi:hypothetical protein
LRARTGAAAVALAAALTACSSSTTFPTAGSTLPATTTPIASEPTSFRELAQRLVARVPPEFELQADNVGDTGPSDLAKAVKDDGAPGAEAALRAEGFVRGYQRLWAGPKDAEIIVYVYQFATPTGAAKDFARDNAAIHSEAPPGATAFTVAGIPAGSSEALAGKSSDVSAAIVLFTTGAYNVQVISHGPALAGLQARAAQIAQDQYQRLHRGP